MAEEKRSEMPIGRQFDFEPRAQLTHSICPAKRPDFVAIERVQLCLSQQRFIPHGLRDFSQRGGWHEACELLLLGRDGNHGRQLIVWRAAPALAGLWTISRFLSPL